jgi:hypothetical protein
LLFLIFFSQSRSILVLYGHCISHYLFPARRLGDVHASH